MENLNNLTINGEYDKLVIILERKLYAGDYTYVNHLIQAYINIGCIDKALNLYNIISQKLGEDSSYWILMELGRALIKRNKFAELINILNFFCETQNVMIKTVCQSLQLEINTINNEFEKSFNYVDTKSNWAHLFNNSACHVLKKIEKKLNIF